MSRARPSSPRASRRLARPAPPRHARAVPRGRGGEGLLTRSVARRAGRRRLIPPPRVVDRGTLGGSRSTIPGYRRLCPQHRDGKGYSFNGEAGLGIDGPALLDPPRRRSRADRRDDRHGQGDRGRLSPRLRRADLPRGAAPRSRARVGPSRGRDARRHFAAPPLGVALGDGDLVLRRAAVLGLRALPRGPGRGRDPLRSLGVWVRPDGLFLVVLGMLGPSAPSGSAQRSPPRSSSRSSPSTRSWAAPSSRRRSPPRATSASISRDGPWKLAREWAAIWGVPFRRGDSSIRSCSCRSSSWGSCCSRGRSRCSRSTRSGCRSRSRCSATTAARTSGTSCT